MQWFRECKVYMLFGYHVSFLPLYPLQKKSLWNKDSFFQLTIFSFFQSHFLLQSDDYNIGLRFVEEHFRRRKRDRDRDRERVKKKRLWKSLWKSEQKVVKQVNSNDFKALVFIQTKTHQHHHLQNHQHYYSCKPTHLPIVIHF